MRLKEFYERIGFPRFIIGGFLVILLIAAFFLDVKMLDLLYDIFVRFGMNGILVLAMVPGIQSGIGLNFALPLGIIFGLVGVLIAIELKLRGWLALGLAILIALPLAVIAGYFYGLMLNRVKGQEMTVGNYVGYSIVSFTCIFWLLAPFTSPQLIWALGGKGLRVTIALEDSIGFLLNNFLAIKIGGFTFPTGLFLTFGVFAFILWLFNNSKPGLSMRVAGGNQAFAKLNGLKVDRYRILGTILSTVLGAIGIIVYSQAFGFLQLYTGPLYAALPAVASILIGGASTRKAKIIHVIIGTALFQSLLVVALPVINIVSGGSMSEVIRIIISNGIILYALTRPGGKTI